MDLCKLTIFAHLRFLRTFSMLIWTHHRNALWCQKFSCNSIPVKRYFSWTIADEMWELVKHEKIVLPANCVMQRVPWPRGYTVAAICNFMLIM